tara:strand:- start:1622 stop:1987 length:366 start_codon:yes stop_codon:yes gene_type:complete
LSVYPTGLTNYFYPTDIPSSADRVLILDGPIVVKSFSCNQRCPGSGQSGSFSFKLFDGIDGEEIFRVFTGVAGAGYGGAFPRFSFVLPMNGLRVLNSLMLEFTSLGAYNPATAGISVLYQR